MPQDASREATLTLDTLQIEDETADSNPYAEKGAPYKARISGDARRTQPLAETPATITVLTQSQIKESGRSDLRDIVGAQPGITIGTGENGNAFGDRYVIRGQEARSDVFIDSLRDPGMTVRESFAVEQVEIIQEFEIPPPPEQIARPATPVISDAVIDEDITITETTFEDNPVENLPPPPTASNNEDISAAPRFTPFTVRPELRNRAEIARALERNYPPLLRDAGIGLRLNTTATAVERRKGGGFRVIAAKIAAIAFCQSLIGA